MEPYLYHGIRFNNIETLYKILDSGFILPRCMIKGSENFDRNNIFNGTKYISLTMKTLMDEHDLEYYRSSFDEVILGSLCIVIDGFKDIVFPSYVDWDRISTEEAKRILFKDDDQRYSYYLDEVQTNKRIPISNFIAIGYPNYTFEYHLGTINNKEQLLRLKERLLTHGLDIPIVDSSSYYFADDRDNIKKYTLVK